MIAGVDGCKAGWVVAIGDRWPCEQAPRIEVLEKFQEVLNMTRNCEAAVVDMPIGLPTGAAIRKCDQEAKEELSPDGSGRVFLAPPAESLAAETKEAFQEIHKQLRGIGAGLPVWGIVPKLKEVNKAMSVELQNWMKEYHPELAWKRLAGRVLNSKHTAAGVLQRTKVLQQQGVSWLLELGEAEVAGRMKLDDLLDSLVGLAVAAEIRRGKDPPFRHPVVDPPRDSRGLRMEIWF